MTDHSIKTFHVAAYYRLSSEDVGVSQFEKKESSSIANQRILIKDFLKDKKDLILYREYTDDGVSGSSFLRPAFNQLMEDIEAGLVNCVIVKDLSRFGREYIDAGKLLERTFPKLGVRFISINDNIDTLHGMDSLMIAFKNVVNDAYCRDISIKTRTNLAIKRKQGEFVGASTVYGYEKHPNDHNKLVVDEYAGHIVQSIFLWRIQGMSCYSIANRLNEMKILTPYLYKMHRGINYATPFKQKDDSKWEAMTVRRILENEIYTGTLIQGRNTTANHKVKKRIIKKDHQCAKVENMHEALVSKRDFELVQRTLKMDTKNAPGQEKCYPLSGMLTCGDCGANLTRKPRMIDGKQYVYYECGEYSSSHRKLCSSHAVREDKIEKLVLMAIQRQIEVLLEVDECVKQLDLTTLMEIDKNRLKKLINMYSAESIRYQGMIKRSYNDLFEGVITKEEYIDYKEEFETKAKSAEKGLADAEHELKSIEQKSSYRYQWIEYFLKYKNVTELSREMVIELVDAVIIYDKKHIEIVLAFQEEYIQALNEINDMKNRKGEALYG